MESGFTLGIRRLATESADELAEIKQLLSACELPTANLSPSSSLPFFGIYSAGKLVGVIGLEIYGTDALLRSLAVVPALRRQGLGKALVTYAETYAASIGIESLFLLTTTADAFFADLGYSPASREDAPQSIQATTQFSGLCPASSAFMIKHLPVIPASSHSGR